MSGKRTKALRREFTRLYGRSPELIEYPGVLAPVNKAKWKRRWDSILATMMPKTEKLLGPLVAHLPEIPMAPANEFRRFRRGLVRLGMA